MVSPDLERLRQQVLAQPGGVAGPARIKAAPQPVQGQESQSYLWPAFVYRLWYRLEPVIKVWYWLQSTAAEPYSAPAKVAAWAEAHTWTFWKLRILGGIVIGACYGAFLLMTCPTCADVKQNVMAGTIIGGGVFGLLLPALALNLLAFLTRWWRWVAGYLVFLGVATFISRVVIGVE